ncbi:MAG TPA: ACP synthase [Polyangia bacterium]|nr:ACP synthase [Polyangia bacterium]
MTASPMESHVGELALRRLRAGEALPDAETHASACADCRARLKGLDDEQRRFEQEISFDRFAAGVERASRAAAPRPERSARVARSLRFMVPTLSLAAGVALFLTFTSRHEPRGPNRLMGGAADITVRVAAGDGPQRTASPSAPEALAPGERVRIGYHAGPHRYLLSLSIDERGQVTPLYPESGRSVAVGKVVGAAPSYLPDSVEFTDSGTERLFVILSDQPIDVEAARRAARAAFERAKGDILHMPALELPGEQFQRTFIKP